MIAPMAAGCCGARVLRVFDPGPLDGLLVGGFPGAVRATAPAPEGCGCAACAAPWERSAGVVMPLTFSTRFRRSTDADLRGLTDLALYQRETDLAGMDFARSTAQSVIDEYRAELANVRHEALRREMESGAPPPEGPPDPSGAGPSTGGGSGAPPEPARPGSGGSESSGAGLGVLFAAVVGLAILAK